MELRKDYLIERWVIISERRDKRPHEFNKSKAEQDIPQKDCIFCPGNENLTPQTKGMLREKDNSWSIRWFNNKFPASSFEGIKEIKNDNVFFTYSSPYGEHEVVVETKYHDKQLSDLSQTEIKSVLKIYSDRIEELGKKEGVRYVNVFKNHGLNAGTSIVHSHTQIISLNKIPNYVKEVLEAYKSFPHCPHCDIINIEKGSYRRVFENDSFVSFTPYASRSNYEVWIFPKKHLTKMNELSEDDFYNLADMLKKILVKLKEINASYNLYIRYAPKDTNMHMHIVIEPRIPIWGGFEFCSDIIINTVSPESAASFYRGEK